MEKIIEIELTAMAHGGAALGRYEGRVVFVRYGIPGETVRARIVEDKGRFAQAEVVEVLDPVPERVTAPCPHYGPGQCGGCHWQHIAYDAQLKYKQTVVRDQLIRIGKFDDPVVLPTLAAPDPWRYRMHATFTAVPGYESFTELDESEEGEEPEEIEVTPLLLGFYSDDNSHVVPIEECHILYPSLHDLHEKLSLGAPEIERVRLQTGSNPDERMLIISTKDDLAPHIAVDFPVSVNLLLNDNEPVNLIGSPQVHYEILGRRFQVTAGGFFQVNLPVAELLVQEVLARLALEGHETVLDLYSGVGLFSAFVAAQADLVLSVESYPPAVTDADLNLAELDNVDIVEGPVEAVLQDLEGPFDAVLLDPPRAGLAVEVIDELIRLATPLIVYVSCDPATMARDAQRLCSQGYVLENVQPVDMFPQTYHVECVASLRLK